MPEFKSIAQKLTTTSANIYTCPAGKSAIIKTLQISNNHLTGDYYATIQLSNGTTDYDLAYQINIPARGAVSIISGDLYLPAGYSIKALAENDTNIYIIGSVVEI